MCKRAGLSRKQRTVERQQRWGGVVKFKREEREAIAVFKLIYGGGKKKKKNDIPRLQEMIFLESYFLTDGLVSHLAIECRTFARFK